MHSPLFSSTNSAMKELRASRMTTVDTLESPYQSRAKSIGKKFNSIHNIIEQATHMGNKAEQVEQKIRTIDTKMIENNHMIDTRLKDFEQKVPYLEENLAAEIIARELLEERKIKQIITVENNLGLALKDSKQEEKEAEKRILNRVEEKILTIRTGFNDEQKKLEELRNEQNEFIHKQIDSLNNGVRSAKEKREEAQYAIIKSVNDKLAHIKYSVEAERKVRHETEGFLYNKIEEISNSLNAQLMMEREKREKTESQMLSYLEEACNKLEGKVRPMKRYR